MKEELKVLFYLKKNRAKANGLCPVMRRITIGRTIAQFGAKLEADASGWDAKTGRMIGKNNLALSVNHSPAGFQLFFLSNLMQTVGYASTG
ncbi:MAG: hypothetical protein LBS42_01185 [Tannerella sp.]|jgi:hypothetical protein|nr:hypothetical protein [Tannerella sp.]